MRRSRFCLCSLLLVATCFVVVPSRARADLGWHVDVGASEAITIPQAVEFGVGGSAGLRIDVPFSRKFGVVLGGSAMVLSADKPPATEGLTRKAEGIAAFTKLGLLWHPVSRDTRRGMWLQVAVGPAFTGNLIRPSGSAAIGYAYPLTDSMHVGPYAEYNYILQPDNTLRPEDAHLGTIGLSLGFGPAPRDEDKDGIYDSVDACPRIPGLRSEDPAKHGCPMDVAPPPAEEDKDIDKDGILIPADACPDVAGVASEDPKKNGCPAEVVAPEDPDGDGIVKPFDACPGVAGIPSEDAASNGCPKADGDIHVEADKIVVGDTVLFDTDSPRVRHRAWPTLQKVAKFIKSNPDIREVTVEGHADATGGEDYNMRLSLDRAMAVRRMLIKYGIAADAIQAESFGRSRLRVQTTRAEAKNRRVELWVTRSKTQGEGTGQ